MSVESEFDEVFEVLDINKESHIFRVVIVILISYILSI